MTSPIPVTLIGGYLGAGKTTLVNHLLRNAGGRRLAVLVNEFGSLPIDADLIVAQDENLISISGGCICCSFGSDLVAALIELKGRGDLIDHLLIETSGVALPQSIVQSLALLPGLAIDGVIVLADVETIRERANDRYMSDTVLGQLAYADVILLNKTDLVSPESLGETSGWLATSVPGAHLLPVRNATVPLEVIVGYGPTHASRPSIPAAHAHATDYETLSVETDAPCNLERLAQDLTDPKMGLLRAKGFLRRPDGAFLTIHIVGRRALVEPAPTWVEAPGRLVCIGLKGELNQRAILAAVRV
jgi:G3E family GTPase